MAKYRQTILVDAIQWFKNGDHPNDRVGEKALDIGKLCELRPELLTREEPVDLDNEKIPPEAYYERIEGAVVRFWRRPGISGERKCNSCGFVFNVHGWIDTGSFDEENLSEGIKVCPGDWVIWAPNILKVCKPESFESTIYELVEEPIPVDKRPHSRACGIRKHDHGSECHSNCPTCSGRPIKPLYL